MFIISTTTSGLQALWLWDVDKMQAIKGRLMWPEYEAADGKLLQQADKALTRKAYSVTQKDGIAPSGNKHDYVSLSRYWWPNPDTPDGLPYIYKDGQSNPELNRYDRKIGRASCRQRAYISVLA